MWLIVLTGFSLVLGISYWMWLIVLTEFFLVLGISYYDSFFVLGISLHALPAAVLYRLWLIPSRDLTFLCWLCHQAADSSSTKLKLYRELASSILCKWWSFKCHIGKYTRPIIILFIGRVLYFPISHQKWATFVFSHMIKSHIYAIHCISNYSHSGIWAYADIHSENHCTECEKSSYMTLSV